MPEPVVVVGAGPAGLAVAGALRARGVETRILEADKAVGSSWRRHYDRLHLHTDRGHSGLPASWQRPGRSHGTGNRSHGAHPGCSAV